MSLFGIDVDKYKEYKDWWDIEDALFKEVFDKGCIRYYMGSEMALALQGRKEYIDRNISKIHEIYKRGGASGILIDLVSDVS
jgi:hypothetical protein